MRTVFPEQFRPTIKEFTSLWNDAIFAVDANVLLNLYRYSEGTRTELEKALRSVQSRLFIPHQAAKEFFRNRLTVTASQADEYITAVNTITKLSTTLTNQKKHPFLGEEKLPIFNDTVEQIVNELNTRKDQLLRRLIDDEILDFAEAVFEGRTGAQYDDEEIEEIIRSGELRYQNEIPPGYKDGKKEGSGDPYRKFGDLIVWQQIIKEAKSRQMPVIFITDDKKEDWWLYQSGNTIGPRTELRQEFISEVKRDFWMYTVDKFIEGAAKTSNNTPVSTHVIAEIIEVSQEVRNEKIYENNRDPVFKSITRDEMLSKLDYSEKWANKNNAGFLGLHSFIKNYLGQAGFDYSASYDVIRQLEDDRLVEVYDHQGEGHERAAKALRLVRPGRFENRPFEGLGATLQNTASVAKPIES